MKYAVEINKDTTIDNLNEKEAIEQAELWAADGHDIIISWFRASDGQHGYLNRDGHSATGEHW